MSSPMFRSSSNNTKHINLASYAHCAIRGLPSSDFGRIEGKTNNFARGRGQLSNDVVESIFRRLPDAGLVRTKALSSFWYSSAESLLASRNTPFLVLPPPQEGEERAFTNYSWEVEDQYRLVNVQENMAYPLKKKTSDVLAQTCIGSSHGWLIFCDFKTLTPVLVNPFTEENIVLPSFKSSLGIVEMEETNNPKQYRYLMETGRNNWRESDSEAFESLVERAILTADPAMVGDYGVVLMCSEPIEQTLLYYKNGDDSWKSFFAMSRYSWRDVICFQNRIYLLRTIYEVVETYIYSWDIQNGYPANMILIKPAIMRHERLFEYEGAKELDVCGHFNSYLVEFNGELLHVLRVMGFRLESEDKTFKTWSFILFKLDSEKKRWRRVKKLGRNVALFVGKNHSAVVSTSEKFGNRIYFTAETKYREWSGRDMGIYSLNGEQWEKRIKPIINFSEQVQFSPIPCWLFPSH